MCCVSLVVKRGSLTVIFKSLYPKRIISTFMYHIRGYLQLPEHTLVTVIRVVLLLLSELLVLLVLFWVLLDELR